MIVRIHDVEVGLAIHRQAMRRLKLTRSAGLPLPNGPAEFAVLGKLLHQPAHGGHPNLVLRIHTYTDRPALMPALTGASFLPKLPSRS
jgi:hypothetical protein